MDYPRESCGLIVIRKGREKYVPYKNTARSSERFIISTQEYAEVEEQDSIIAVVHSHPDVPAIPSEADKVSCEASGLVWHIVRVDSIDGVVVARELVTIEPCGYQAPLVGRPFFHGVLDCYSLIRDWYQQTKGIELKQFHRIDDWWNDGNSDLYTRLFKQKAQEVNNTLWETKYQLLRNAELLKARERRLEKTVEKTEVMAESSDELKAKAHRLPDAID